MKSTYTIDGMACEHCKAKVEKTILALEGVQSAVADLAKKTVDVEFDESTLTPEAIQEAVEDAGYGMTL